MFIDYEDIQKEDITIDVRTIEEFNSMPLFKHNIPLINKEEHDRLKKRIYLAIPIILKSFIKNKEEIKKQLLFFSYHGKKRVIIGCSRGRLRSPIIYFYAKKLGINAKILNKGIKRFYIKKPNNIKNLYGFLDM